MRSRPRIFQAGSGRLAQGSPKATTRQRGQALNRPFRSRHDCVAWVGSIWKQKKGQDDEKTDLGTRNRVDSEHSRSVVTLAEA